MISLPEAWLSDSVSLELFELSLGALGRALEQGKFHQLSGPCCSFKKVHEHSGTDRADIRFDSKLADGKGKSHGCY